MANDNDFSAESVKSKSQVKREMTALQKLGEKLVKLNKEQLSQLDLPENLLAAVWAAKQITAHGGRRRQMQYIGKLMRTVDATPIANALASLENQHQHNVIQLQQLEQWRERLITEGKAALTQFMQDFANADAQLLRHLIKHAQSEQQAGKPAGASRKLFRYLRELHQAKNEQIKSKKGVSPSE